MEVFFSAEDRSAYLAHLKKSCRHHGVEVWAWCLMRNHVHLIVVPSKEDSLSRCFSEAHGRYTHRINKRQGWKGHLWQARFGSSVLDEPHMISAVRYVERNPVRAGMVRVPWRYPWSSARWHTGREATDPLIEDGGVLKDLIEDWENYLLDEDKEGFVERIRSESSVNRPLGGKIFIQGLERRFSKSLIRKKRRTGDRPPKSGLD